MSNEEAIIVRDCTGTYLRYNSKDYQVCNHDKLMAYPDGKEVKVNFTKINQCKGSGSEKNVCHMIHESEGWIEVQKVK